MHTIYLVGRSDGVMVIEVAGDADPVECRAVIRELQADLRRQPSDERAEELIRRGRSSLRLSVDHLPDGWDPATGGRQVRFLARPEP